MQYPTERHDWSVPKGLLIIARHPSPPPYWSSPNSVDELYTFQGLWRAYRPSHPRILCYRLVSIRPP